MQHLLKQFLVRVLPLTNTKISEMRMVRAKNVMQHFIFDIKVTLRMYVYISSRGLTSCLPLKLCISESVNILSACYMQETVVRAMIISSVRLTNLPSFNQVGVYALGYVIILCVRYIILVYYVSLQEYHLINTHRTMRHRYIGDDSQLLRNIIAYRMGKPYQILCNILFVRALKVTYKSLSN